MKIKGFVLYWLPVVLYASVIFYLSSLSQPLPAGVSGYKYMDLILHALEYFVLSALLLRAFLYSSFKRPYVYAIVLSALYGILDEVHQLFVIERVFSGYDMIADAVGACFILLFLLHEKKTLQIQSH
ncbi:MAG: VanZ family protein [Nanoarchaeota archaeon]|nr:VanZ family protein [Nanoarchaeota archaeon]